MLWWQLRRQRKLRRKLLRRWAAMRVVWPAFAGLHCAQLNSGDSESDCLLLYDKPWVLPC